eukprot:1148257-Pelagomonas_calceolata.AAC.7
MPPPGLPSIGQRTPHALRLPNHIISSMKTERHNVAGGIIIKAICPFPPHIMCYAAGMAPHRGPVQLPE